MFNVYEVVAGNKTITPTMYSLENAMKIAKKAFETHNYVEVKEIVSLHPWYARSVKIFIR